MAKNAVHRPRPSKKAPPPILRFELQEFARRLLEEMQKKGWTQADLARAAFGATTDSRGYNVARGRDRISVYVRGIQKPDQAHLAKIAAALGVDAEELAPGLFANAIDREHPAFRVNVVPGHSDKAHLIINRLVPMTMAMKIGQLISTLDDENT